MKKLMVAAALAAMTVGAANAKDICSDDYEDTSSCMLYDVKFTFKTLMTAKKAYVASSKASACEESYCSSCYYLDQKTRTFKGYLWDCIDYCWEAGDEINFVLWDATNKKPVSALLVPPAMSESGLWEGDTFTFDVLDRYTKKANKVEAFFNLDLENAAIAAAGFGSYDAKMFNEEGGLKSVSGNAVALFTDFGYTVSSKCEEGTDVIGAVLSLCACYESICDGDEAEKVVGSGTWSIKYNKGLSKGNKTLRSLVPAYMIEK